jgi:hypothetical protein
MPIKLSARILLRSDALPYLVGGRDEGGVIVEGENNEKINPFLSNAEDTVLMRLASNRQWTIPENEGDERFTCFLQEPPNMLRPGWFADFMDHARKMRSHFKVKGEKGYGWKTQQSIIKHLVLRFFNDSKALKTKVSLFRASIVLALFLICHSKSKSMTNMVLHLARSCSFPPPARRTAVDPKPVRLSRPSTKHDVRKVIKNQETLYVMLINLESEIAKLTQNRKGTRTNPIGDQEPDKVFEMVHLSDDSSEDSASASEVEDDVDDEVEDQVEDEVEYGDHDESGNQDDDDDEDESQSEDEENGRRKRRRL